MRMKVPTLRTERSCPPNTATPRPQISSGSIRHYNGSKRTLNRWDGFRKDPTLWFEDGDCYVHLYALSGAQQGPSFRLRYEHIRATRCEYLLERCLHRCSQTSRRTGPKTYEMYIPAPAGLTKAQTYDFHLTTRNFFAYATSTPLVGETLGLAFVRLVERIKEWQPEADISENFTQYYQQQGYSDMAENVDYALASLALAEWAQLKTLWTVSFVHSVGMHERLHQSPEYDILSNSTKAMVTRASLKMEIYIAKVIQALGTFLEYELGRENLGLSKPARDHLDRFRSCLHNYYVEKLGYYPPSEDGPWNKRLWTKMYYSFHSLYKYLVDEESSTDPTNSRNVNGGICVAQNVQAFDEKHGYPPLPHPMPLLPVLPARKRSASVKRGLRELKLGKTILADPSIRQALAQATNSSDPMVMESELVQEYQCFERLPLEERLSVSEARKVRWLLIYGVLQMLISITTSPIEVGETKTPSYPLCVPDAGRPAWLEAETSVNRGMSTTNLLDLPALPPSPEEGRGSRISIHPDCEADCAEDYFSSQSPSVKRNAQLDRVAVAPASSRTKMPLSRPASFRYSVHSGVSALQRSFSRRNSVQKMPDTRPPSLASSWVGTLEDTSGYDIADKEDSVCSEVSAPCEVQVEETGPTTDALAAFDFGLDNVNEEPVWQDTQLDLMFDPALEPPLSADRLTSAVDISRNPSDASTNITSRSHIESDRSSNLMFEIESATTDASSAEDEDEFIHSTHRRPLSYAPANPDIGWEGARYSLQHGSRRSGVRHAAFNGINAGCYVPTGYPGFDSRSRSLPVSKLARRPWAGSEELYKPTGVRLYVSRQVQSRDGLEYEQEQDPRGRGRIR